MSGSARAHALRFYVMVVGFVVVASAVGALRERARLGREAPGGTEVGVSSCAPRLEPIAGGGCFARASGSKRPSTLLVYLHGRYSPEGEAEEMDRQTRVARMASARGYSVLTLRGAQGQCTDPQLASWWCWPSNERNASDGPAFVTRWSSALAEAERRVSPTRRVLLGFSNGGYFAALIASRALSRFDAVAIAHAGPVAPMAPRGPTPPILLVDAEDDPSSPETSRLDAELSRLSWPHALVSREGGHALPEWDVGMALSFFDRVRTERLPLHPPLAPPLVRAHHPTPDKAESASDAGASGQDDASPPPPAQDSGASESDAASEPQ